jgi:RNA polymerase sigma-70 factor (TIGR02957 family)
MKVFVAGATGAIGRQLLPLLAAAGHEVVGMTRSESKGAALRELGATPVIADALDPEQVAEAVGAAQPEAIVHQLTAIDAVDLRRFDRDFALTNRLRTEGTDHLLSAGRAVGVRRVVAQSYTGWPYARTGGPVKREEDPLDPAPAREMRESLTAIRHLETAVADAAWTEGIVLRYGAFYGPGTSLSPGGAQIEMIRRRRFPVVGSGAGVWSFVHVADAAEATLAALERGTRGIYNIVDDDPAPVAEWLPALAQGLGAPRPRAGAQVPGAAARRRGGRGHDDRGARRIEREGQARARLAAATPQLARGVRRVTPEPAGDAVLDELRPASFAIAYRMLGSVSEAEDIVQEALWRVHRALASGEQIESPRAYAATVTTRLAIDELRSARARRERYVGEWLPEPVLTEGRDDPARHAEMSDSLSMALLVLLERLSPVQRAVLLLHDVFDYGYEEIARIVGKSEANVRQLAARARRHVEEGRPRYESSRAQRDELARRFYAAAQAGDLAALEELLAEDVVLTGDGGGRVPALARSLHGRDRVARTLLNWLRLGDRIPGASMRPVEVNGAPGALLLDGAGRVIAVWALEIAGGRIRAISSVVNPDKLGHLGPVADVRALLRPGPG